MDFSQITPEDYYNTPSLHGRHQYETLEQIVNNFMLNYVGDDHIIKKINRHIVLFHAKRGLQELSYDVLKDIKAIELDINPNTLSAILPQGYVSFVRISQVSETGKFLPLAQNKNSVIADTYLQDNEYNILFDASGDVIKANNNSYDPVLNDYYSYYDYYDGRSPDGTCWVDTTENSGLFIINERSGVIKFSSDIKDATIVIEYISDGFDHASESDIVIHKHGVSALYAYIEWGILDSMEGVQEYVVRRKLRAYKAKFNNTAIRRMSLDTEGLMKILKGIG